MLFSTFFRIIKIVVTVIFMVGQPAFAIESNTIVSPEVEQLITFVETSDCQFNRNGRWYDSREAAKHIEKKYRYVKKRGLVKTTEDFIKYAATKSSMSGKVYMVQCVDQEPLTCSQWLTTELARCRGLQ